MVDFFNGPVPFLKRPEVVQVTKDLRPLVALKYYADRSDIERFLALYFSIFERLFRRDWNSLCPEEQEKALYQVNNARWRTSVARESPLCELQEALYQTKILVVFEFVMALAIQRGRHERFRELLCEKVRPDTMPGTVEFLEVFCRVLDGLLAETPDWTVLSFRERHGLVKRFREDSRAMTLSEHGMRAREFNDHYHWAKVVFLHNAHHSVLVDCWEN